MHSTPISLRFAPSEWRVLLRELTGHDERRVSGTSTQDALELIERVLVPIPGKRIATLMKSLSRRPRLYSGRALYTDVRRPN